MRLPFRKMKSEWMKRHSQLPILHIAKNREITVFHLKYRDHWSYSIKNSAVFGRRMQSWVVASLSTYTSISSVSAILDCRKSTENSSTKPISRQKKTSWLVLHDGRKNVRKSHKVARKKSLRIRGLIKGDRNATLIQCSSTKSSIHRWTGNYRIN